MPPPSPQTMLGRTGASRRSKRTSRSARPPASWLQKATTSAGSRRDCNPPKKSAVPQHRLEPAPSSNVSSIPNLRLLSAPYFHSCHILYTVSTSTTAMPLIDVQDLHKTFKLAVRTGGPFGALRSLVAREYRSVHAVDGVSFTLESGEMVGYIGPNGAGKSTTIKMLTGILVPSSGHILVDRSEERHV